MFAIYLASGGGNPVAAWFALAVALGAVVGLGGWRVARGRRWMVGLAVAVTGALLMAGTAEAVVIPCPREWKWLGIC